MPPQMIFHAAWLDAKTDFNGVGLKRTFCIVLSTFDDSVTITETTPGFNNALFLKSSLLPYKTKGNQSILKKVKKNFKMAMYAIIEVHISVPAHGLKSTNVQCLFMIVRGNLPSILLDNNMEI